MPRWESRRCQSLKRLHGSVDASKLSIEPKDNSATPSSSTSSALPRFEEPFIAWIRINNVEACCLIDTGASGDFVSSHFAYTNHLKHRKLDSAIPIQEAVKGSKPKCNAVATATIRFGDWTRKTSMYVIHLAHHDAIIGLPTLMDAGLSSIRSGYKHAPLSNTIYLYLASVISLSLIPREIYLIPNRLIIKLRVRKSTLPPSRNFGITSTFHCS